MKRTILLGLLLVSFGAATAIKPAPAIVSVTTYGAKGDGIADDSTAIQAAIDAVRPGGIVEIPLGRYRLATGILISKAIVIRGQGVTNSDNSSPFGSTDYATVYETGTVLECVATSGVALDVRNSTAPVYLENLCVKGIGEADRTTGGIRLGQPGQAGPSHARLRDVMVLNFATGLEINNSYDSRYECVTAYGCNEGLRIGTNQAVFTQTKVSACKVGVHLIGGQSVLFYGGAIQACSDIGFLIEQGEEHLIEGFYFENKGARLAIEVRSDTNRVTWNHFGTPKDQIAVSGNGNVIFSATKAIGGLAITGADTTILGPINANLKDTGTHTALLPPMGAYAPPAPSGDLTVAGNLTVTGAIRGGALDLGNGRKWTADGLFPAAPIKWPGTQGGVLWNQSNGLYFKSGGGKLTTIAKP